MVPGRQTGTTITWADFAGGSRTPWKVSSFSRCVSCASPSASVEGRVRQPSDRLLDRPRRFGGWVPQPTPKGSAASNAASATLDNAKHARPPRLGEKVAKLEAKPFARQHAFGRVDTRSPNLGSPTGMRTTPAPNDSVNPDRAPSSLGSTTGKPDPSPSGEISGAECAARRPASTAFLPRALRHRPEPEREAGD